MFNLFLTFSIADLHDNFLHRLLPKSYTKNYLDKKVVKNLNDIPDGEERSKYIDEKRDILLRKKAIDENCDICNEYFIKKLDLLWKHVFKPVLSARAFIKRYEFQHRGSIHCHMVLSIEGGPSCTEMDLAKKKINIPKETEINVQSQETVQLSLKNVGNSFFLKKIQNQLTIAPSLKIIREKKLTLEKRNSLLIKI